MLAELLVLILVAPLLRADLRAPLGKRFLASDAFAVVPCCVYSAEAPDRRNPRTGKRIVSMSTAAFIEYLVHKGGGPGKVGVATLPFAGKNVVVFSRPERSAECTQGASAANQHCLPCDSETSVA